MAVSLLNRISGALQRLEHAIVTALRRSFPPDAVCVAGFEVCKSPHNAPTKSSFSLRDLIGDGFLWAVPRNRRTIEKRLKRKFGDPYYVLKILQPNTRLRTCNTCGDDHEAGVLCPTCYKKVMDETKAMQETIQNELQLTPVEKEVVVLYDGEKDEKPSEFWEGKRIIEMKKPRPSWFSKNLLQQTTQQPATTSDIKPSQLG